MQNTSLFRNIANHELPIPVRGLRTPNKPAGPGYPGTVQFVRFVFFYRGSGSLPGVQLYPTGRQQRPIGYGYKCIWRMIWSWDWYPGYPGTSVSFLN
eukprot:548358-Rhodomonas_salina.1